MCVCVYTQSQIRLLQGLGSLELRLGQLPPEICILQCLTGQQHWHGTLKQLFGPMSCLIVQCLLGTRTLPCKHEPRCIWAPGMGIAKLHLL